MKIVDVPPTSIRRPRGWMLRAHRMVAVVIGIPLSLAVLWSWLGPPSAEAVLFGIGVIACTVSGIAGGHGRWRSGLFGGALLALSVLGYRMVGAQKSANVIVEDLVGGERLSSRWLDRLVPERDLAVNGTRLLRLVGGLGRFGPGGIEALRNGYERMAASEGALPSPVLSTFSRGHAPEDQSLVRVVASKPLSRGPPQAALLFLHGFMGPTTLICWQVAQAAAPLGLETVCPSTSWRATWSDDAGRKTVRETIARMKARGIKRVYLAGLSNGAGGAGRMAPDLEGIDGLILISGALRAARSAHVPTLVISGGKDRSVGRLPALHAKRVGATYKEHPSAYHWLVLSHHAWFTETLQRWLVAREAT